MNDGRILPPLPASDERAMAQNQYDGFYQRRSREFWGHNEIIREVPEDFNEHKHYFIQKPNAAECKICRFGLIGFFEIQDGKLYQKGKPLGFESS